MAKSVTIEPGVGGADWSSIEDLNAYKFIVQDATGANHIARRIGTAPWWQVWR